MIASSLMTFRSRALCSNWMFGELGLKRHMEVVPVRRVIHAPRNIDHVHVRQEFILPLHGVLQ
jgi:hypothetical protein